MPTPRLFDAQDRRRPIDRAREMRRDEIVSLLQPLEAGYEAWRNEYPELAALADEGEEEDVDGGGGGACGSVDPSVVERLQRVEAEDQQVFLELQAQERAVYNGQVE